MTKKFLGLIGLGTLVLSIMLAGCSPSKSKENSDEKVKGEENKKDELVLAFGSEPEAGFDPAAGWDVMVHHSSKVHC